MYVKLRQRPVALRECFDLSEISLASRGIEIDLSPAGYALRDDALEVSQREHERKTSHTGMRPNETLLRKEMPSAPIIVIIVGASLSTYFYCNHQSFKTVVIIF